MSTVDVEIIIQPKGRGKPRRDTRTAKAAAPRIARIARLMALAIKFQDLVDRGEVRDYADLARLGYVSRARLTQIMNLLLLAPDIQEEILGLNSLGDEKTTIVERHVRSLAKVVAWDQQRREWIAGQGQS
jgi:hypothetical protein